MTEIPNAFGGFAPFPNTIMIPTMGLQSAVIGYRFGFGYEQGKRTLRAMSNEQFNNLDEEAEQAIFKRHDSAAINYFKTEMNNWVALQNLIIEKSVEIEVAKAKRTPSAFREMFEGFTSGFSTQQKDDAGKFFAGLNDTLLKIMAFFTGHKQTTIPTQDDVQLPFPPNDPTIPKSSSTKPYLGAFVQPTIPDKPISKKPAGSVQIALRKKTIQLISFWSFKIRGALNFRANFYDWLRRGQKVSAVNTYTLTSPQMSYYKVNLLKQQQVLVNLIQAYSFV